MISEEFINQVKEKILCAISELSGKETANLPELVTEIPPQQELGDLAFPMFKYAKELHLAPPKIAAEVQNKLTNCELIAKSEIKGSYLNIFLNRGILSQTALSRILEQKENVGTLPAKNEKVLIEFSCPNTNKPLHLGHCRNNVLGDSIARIYKKAGFDVATVNLINDRGVHICKSMLAYQKFGNGCTPESTNKKSDHLVGDFYVRFAKEAESDSHLNDEAQEMLVKWEAKDPEVRTLWEKMNNWAINGIQETYDKMGIHFDYVQRESKTYILGKDIVQEGLEKGVFYKEKDNSIWVNNEDVGLDKKIVLRSDGTSIYITQDMGTLVMRQKSFGFDKMIYVVGSEQIYHFQTLFAIMKKLGYKWADNCYHLSYGMVNLPDGKMKSREGKVVDADNLMEELQRMSYDVVCEKHPDWTDEEKQDTARKISLGAMKYYLLNFNTGKDVMFDPKKSISFDGNTGPYLQYTTARINSLLKKAGNVNFNFESLKNYSFRDEEWQVISMLMQFEHAVAQAAAEYSPLEICSYLYDLVRLYSKMYHELPIVTAEKQDEKEVRLMITKAVQYVLTAGLEMLGIDALEKM